MISTHKEEGEENSDIEADMERQEGSREIEKFVHGIRNGELVGGPSNGRRMRHATREGNKPSFWTHLKENGCRGCQKQGGEETIHHVLSGACEALGTKMNSIYKEEMRRGLEKCKKLMSDKQNIAGVIQVNKAIRSMERPRRHTIMYIREEEELALRQIISGIITEGQEGNEKEKKETITAMKL
eukprot:1106413-Pleurochrysis_carterae.AAC.3